MILRNGLSLESPVIGRYCGNVKPNNIRTQRHNALIEFHTDLETFDRGFRLSVTPVQLGMAVLSSASL